MCNTIYHMSVPRCATCTDARLALVNRERLVKLLEEARKLTHPDICSNPKATHVTAEINSCLDAIRPKLPPKLPDPVPPREEPPPAQWPPFHITFSI